MRFFFSFSLLQLLNHKNSKTIFISFETVGYINVNRMLQESTKKIIIYIYIFLFWWLYLNLDSFWLKLLQLELTFHFKRSQRETVSAQGVDFHFIPLYTSLGLRIGTFNFLKNCYFSLFGFSFSAFLISSQLIDFFIKIIFYFSLIIIIIFFFWQLVWSFFILVRIPEKSLKNQRHIYIV